MSSGVEPIPTPVPNRPVQAETVTTVVLAIATGVVLYLCYLVILPFMPALAWALALAVIAHPVYRWLEHRTKHHSLCAGITVVVITLLLLAPAGFVTHSLVDQASRYAGTVQEGISSGKWEESLKKTRYIGPFVTRLSNLSKELNGEPKKDEPPTDEKKNGEEQSQERPKNFDTAGTQNMLVELERDKP